MKTTRRQAIGIRVYAVMFILVAALAVYEGDHWQGIWILVVASGMLWFADEWFDG